VVGEKTQRRHQTATPERNVVILQFIGGGFHLVQNVGNSTMIGFEPVYDRTKSRIGAADSRKDMHVLAVVMQVNEPAVMEAAEL
jgi:hypothetical protein